VSLDFSLTLDVTMEERSLIAWKEMMMKMKYGGGGFFQLLS
jgi:hypothetical protein